MKNILLGVTLALAASLSVFTAEKPRVTAGNGTLIIGSYPKQFWIIDEATEKVVGSIPYQSGIPRRTTMTRDRKRFYTIEAAMEKVEIVDIAARKTIDVFTLSEGNKKVRIRSIRQRKVRFSPALQRSVTPRWRPARSPVDGCKRENESSSMPPEERGKSR